jgi:hypothetical protein
LVFAVTCVVFLVLNYIGHRSVRILMIIKKQVIAANVAV